MRACVRCSPRTAVWRTSRYTDSSWACACARATARVRDLVPTGIELTPPRAERSTGPGHRDFEIVGDAEIGVAEDMGRRDFTINAIARRLSTGELVDPFGGVGDLARRELRTVSARSFREDPLRLVRGLRLVSQLDFALSGETLAQMRLEADGLRHVSAERIGGGLAADGLGELSKLLLGVRPAAALLLSRETGILHELLPELVPSVGYRLASDRQPLPLDEHVFATVQHTADHGAPLAVRLAALLHDAGKPRGGRDRRVSRRARCTHRIDSARPPALPGADAAARGVDRAASQLPARRGGRRTLRASLPCPARRHHGVRPRVAEGGRLAAERRTGEKQHEAVAALRAALEAERDSPHRLSDLAVGGDDLRAMGFAEGPELGRVLEEPCRRSWTILRETSARGCSSRRERSPVTADTVRAVYEQLRAEAGPEVTIVAATKYVPLDEMAVLAEAGVEVVGENRAQDLERKHAAYGDAFRWHFIGHLQSNKVKVVNRICELVHSLDSDTAGRRLSVPALLEVNLASEPSKSGVPAAEVGGYVERYPLLRGLMTMPPLARDPEASRPAFRRLRELAREHGLEQLSMGTSQDWRVAVDEGATLIRVGSVLYGDVSSSWVSSHS